MDNRAPSTVNATMRALAAWLRAPFNLLPALSVRQLLIMVVLFTALPLLALALLVSSTIAATERQANRSALMNNVRTLASLVDTEIDTHLALAAALATSPSLQSGDIAAFKHQAIQALAVLPGAWIHLSDPTGQVVMSTVIPDGAVLPRRNRLAFMQQMWASRQPLLSDVEMSITKQANAVIEVPVFKGGKPLYSIVVGLSPERFLALLRDGMGRDTVVGLLDRKANFVARIPDHAARVGTPASQNWRDAMADSILFKKRRHTC